MNEEDGELLLLEKPQVFMYKIPARYRSKVDFLHRATDWDTAHPVWKGKIRISNAGFGLCQVELKDSNGKLFGLAQIKEYPGKDFQPVLDSTRYFTLRIQKPDGNCELVGIGFSSRINSSEFHEVASSFFLRRPPCGSIKREIVVDETFNDSNEVVIPVKKIKTEINPLDKENLEATSGGVIHELHICQSIFEEPRPGATETVSSLAIPLQNIKIEPPPCEVLQPTQSPETGETNKRRRISKWHLTSFYAILYCSFCQTEFHAPDDLIQHFQDNHNPRKKKQCKDNYNSPHSPEILPSQIYALSKDPDYKYFVDDSFKCEERLCGKTFIQSSQLMRHWVYGHKKQRFVKPYEPACCLCGLPFRYKGELDLHNDEYHSIPCKICYKNCVTEDSLEEHSLQHHLCDSEGKTIHLPKEKSSRSFNCKTCEGWFDFRTFQWAHVPWNHDYQGAGRSIIFKGVPECDECETIISNFPYQKEGIREHLRQVHGCNLKKRKRQRSIRSKRIVKFKEVNEGSNPTKKIGEISRKCFQCAYCNEVHVNRQRLLKHFLASHAKTQPSPLPGRESNRNDSKPNYFPRIRDPNYKYIFENIFHCRKEVCEEEFTRSDLIIEHWRSNHNLAEAGSCKCGLPLPTKGELELHIPCCVLTCPICFREKKSFKLIFMHMLKTHLCDISGTKINSKDNRKFQCKICTEWFHFKVQLRNHRKSVHNIGRAKINNLNVICLQCGKTFKKEIGLRDHKRALKHE